MTIGSLAGMTGTGQVQSAIARASAKTGVDFSYLLGQAQVESSLRPDARARTSSATGLYQFIDQSWLAVVKRHGEEHGLGWAADAIQRGAGGRYYVADSRQRAAILDLRTNSEAASLMAAEHAADNKAVLEASLGRTVGGTDLYMAHFLGVAGAGKFLSTMAHSPERSAAALFPAAASANRGIFYATDGRARSLSEIYDRFAAKIDEGTRLAATGKSLPPAANAGRPTLAVDMAALGERNGGDGDMSTLDRLLANGAGDRATMLRPTPETAKLAYLMLAALGG
ncbi:lytic transglycosylase domain-containing protein [Sphingomonas flavalba]|uniref:lytic transglycosylase domain-containing protein n=1 Tax=Sphingomonas flavalba TaxID=2559804 RepID=UPI0019D31048|nr:lytic transglycosylase domain-containing protein [Sphingomonas flavalba]